MTDLTDRLDAIEKRAEGLTDLCAEHLRQGIRHLQRNCNIDCNVHEDEDAWADCKQPDRYDGDRMAAVLADIPALLVLARKQQAAINAAKAEALRDAARAITTNDPLDFWAQHLPDGLGWQEAVSRWLVAHAAALQAKP
jgi:hypothetical protein